MKIIESLMGKAYMLDKDNNLIEVKYHPYGYEGDIEENSSCAYFLWKYGNNDIGTYNEIFNMLLNFISYCFNESADTDIEDIEINSREFSVLAEQIFDEFDVYSIVNGWSKNNNRKEVYNDLISIVKNSMCRTTMDLLDIYDENDDNIEAYLTLNEDYVRVRIGGRYDNDREDCIYFRISSIGYDWGDNIMNIVFEKFKDKVNYITIERDLESAKLNKAGHKIYTTKDGQSINHLPIEDFIYQEHIPLVASINRTSPLLILMESGNSLFEIRKSMPKAVILSEYKRIVREQIRTLRSK